MPSSKSDLTSIIKILESENEALSERAEDSLLFGLVAETIYHTEDSLGMIDQVLERISILKSIPVCICLKQVAEELRVENFYTSFAELQWTEIELSFPDIRNRIPADEGFLILNKSDFDQYGFSVQIQDRSFVPASALIVSCYSKSSSSRFFVFLDDDKSDNRFPKLFLLLQQLVKLVAERLDNIFVFSEVTRLNRELDQRVKERTEELTRVNNALINEIQERKSVEKELVLREKWLRLIYNAAIDVSFITVDLSKDFIIRSFSPGAEQMFGYSSGEVVGKSLQSFHLFNQSNMFSAIRDDFRKYGWSHREETSLLRKSGECFSGMLTVYPLAEDDMDNTGVLAVCIDISALKQTQNELIEARRKAEESESKFRTLFEQASDGIFIADGAGNYLEVNESACLMLGYSKEEMLKLNLKDILSKKSLEDEPVKMKELKTGNIVLSERVLVRKDGSSFFAEISGKMLPDGRLQGIVRDVTERRRFENELVAAKEKAEESDRLKTSFLQNMSHEIRTPMNAILGFADLLPEFFDDHEKLTNFSNIIKQKGTDLLEIISNILDIARIESGQIALNAQECRMGVLFDEIGILFREYQEGVKNDQVEFELKIGEEVRDLVIEIDQAKLKQILINLIGNAFKFTRSGKIELGCRLDEQSILSFYVSDTGIGIPKEKHEDIFRQFIRVDQDSVRLYDGTGLGLPIVLGLLELMGGKIWLESEKGVGTTFYFTVPFGQRGELLQKLNKQKMNPEYAKSKNVKILIIDHDEYNVMYLKEILAEAKFDFIYVRYGKQALEVCSQQAIDLVLMDIHPVDMTGSELISMIRELNPQIRVIAQSVHATPEDEENAMLAGSDDYLGKPVKGELLLSRIKHHLVHLKKQVDC